MLREEVSHELRTPLTTVKGVLQLLVSGRLHASSDGAREIVAGAWRQALLLEEVVGRVEALFHDRPQVEEAVVIAVENGVTSPDS